MNQYDISSISERLGLGLSLRVLEFMLQHAAQDDNRPFCLVLHPDVNQHK